MLKAQGYAGLTIAKVAARAGENKALISYHFGSKQGLVAAVGREVGDAITAQVLAGLDDARTVEQVVRGVLDGIWRVLERDERLGRLYFDLSAVSVVEDDVRKVMREMREGWRSVLRDLLRRADDGLAGRETGTAAILVMAGIEGLALERIGRGETRELRRARELFVRSTAAALAGGR